MDESIIVAIHCVAYNHEYYIRQCLDGFVMQKTDFKFVAIVHDDASTDKTTDIIREYEANYPEIIKPIYEIENQYSKRNGSLRRIMDAAINATGAKYIALCEGDDYWTDPNKLQKQVDFLEAHPEYSMCFHRAEIENGLNLKTYILCEYVENRDYSPNELLKDWIVPTASILGRKDCYDVPLKNQEKLIAGDIVFIMRWASIGKIYGFRDCMSVYRIHSCGITQNKQYFWQRSPDHYKCIKNNFPFIDKKIINDLLCNSYFVRAKHPRNPWTFVRDVVLAAYYSPLGLMKILINGFISKTKK